MHPLNNTYPNNHRVDSISDIDDCDTSLNHISTQNLNQINVTGDHENYCGHSKLNILSLNCGSIRSQAKRNNLAVLLSEHNIDIVLGCESHIDESYFSSELLPPLYTILRKDRSLGGGGVFIGFKKSLTVSEEPKLITDCEVIWAKLHFKKTKTLYICSFYRPPDSDMYPIIQLNESLTKLSNRTNGIGWRGF